MFQSDADSSSNSKRSQDDEKPLTSERRQQLRLETRNFSMADIKRVKYVANRNTTEHNIFVIYTKENYMLKTKFEMFVKSLLKYSSVRLHLHIISDVKSEASAEETIKKQINFYKSVVFYTIYDVEDCAMKLSDITHVMMPYFSSNPGNIMKIIIIKK